MRTAKQFDKLSREDKLELIKSIEEKKNGSSIDLNSIREMAKKKIRG